MKTFTILLLLSLSGCTLSWMNYLPSSACEKVSYDREGNKVVVYAECTV